MASFQADFRIKDSTYMMIQEGRLTLSDGAVRWNEGEKKGQIYEIIKLDEIRESDSDRIDAGINENAELATDNGSKAKTGVIVAILCTLIAVFGYYKWKNRKERAFNKALKSYIEEINHNNNSIEVIERLRGAIKRLKKSNNYEKIKIKLSLCQLETLINEIEQYTLCLAEKNHKKVIQSRIEDKDSIIRLDNYLIAQEQILKEA